MCFSFGFNRYFIVFCRDGLQKLRDVYVQNSSMGDPATVDKDLEKNAKELDMLQQTLTKYQVS